MSVTELAQAEEYDQLVLNILCRT